MVALAVFVAGCGGGGGSKSASDNGTTPKPKAGETLDIYGFGTGDEVADSRIAIAKKTLKPAKVSNPTGGFQDQKFLTLVASGSPPDLIYLDRQKVGEYAARGALLPLDTCIHDQRIDMSMYRQPAVQEVTYDGHAYGIPEFYDNRTLIINDAVARKAGVPVSQIETDDWAKLKQLTKKLAVVRNGKPTRIGFDPKLPEFFPLWVHANGARIISPDGLHAHLDDPKVVEALRYAVGLIDLQGGWSSFKSFRDTWDFFGSGNEFAQDQLGAFPMEDWYYNVLATDSPKAQITGKAFLGRDGRAIDYTTGSAWAIPKGAKHPQLACTWATTMTSVSTWMAAARARLHKAQKAGAPFTGLYTANRIADEKIFATLYKPISPSYDVAVKTVLRVQKHSFALPASPAGAAFEQAWTDAVNRVLAGQQTPAQALKQAQTEAQRAIDNAK